jgi:hypothetical protein
MKRIRFDLLTAVLAVFVGQAWGTMTPQYSSYVTHSADTTHIYATMVVDGTTTGCSLPPYCINVNHQGKVYLTLAGTGGWVYGSQVSPPSYLSVSNAQSLAYTPGSDYTEVTEADVYCSGLGHNIFSYLNSQHIELAVTEAVWTPALGAPSCPRVAELQLSGRKQLHLSHHSTRL